MARCGCLSTCNCAVTAGAGTTVSGNGSAANPYVVSSTATGAGFRAGVGTSVIGGDLDTPATAAGDNALAVGNGTTVDGTEATAVGYGASATGNYSVSIGGRADAQAAETVCLGWSSFAAALGGVAVGPGATTHTAIKGVAVGYATSANGDYATAIGAESDANGASSVAIGVGALSTGARSVAIGEGAAAGADDLGAIQVDEWEVVPSSGANRSVSSVHDSGGTKRRLATIIEEITTVAATGAAETVTEPETASGNHWTLDANCTATFPAAVKGKSFTLLLKQGGAGSFTITWPGTVKWAGGTAPTLTTTVGKEDVFSFWCADGVNWIGFVAGQNF